MAAQSVPMSFPAILLHHGPRVHRPQAPAPKKATPSHGKPEKAEGGVLIKGGKRRRRRWENANFAANPHAAPPSRGDYVPRPPAASPSFPSPPPSAFPSSTTAPSQPPPAWDAASAHMGKFTRSLKGIRRSVRRIVGGEGAGRGAEVVEAVERELVAWLGDAVWLAEDLERGRSGGGRVVDPTPYPRGTGWGSGGTQASILELSRAPSALAWAVPDAFVRYLVHCVARYYNIVSFGKEDLQGRRVIWLMRAHAVGQASAPRGQGGTGGGQPETPPTTASEAGATTEESGDERPTSSASSACEEASASESEEPYVMVEREPPRSRPMQARVRDDSYGPADAADIDDGSPQPSVASLPLSPNPSSEGPGERIVSTFRDMRVHTPLPEDEETPRAQRVGRPDVALGAGLRSASSSPSPSKNPTRLLRPRALPSAAPVHSRTVRRQPTDPKPRFLEWVLGTSEEQD